MSQEKKLNLWDGVMIVSGSMIGSGIFIVSADIVRNVGSASGLLLVWVFTGMLTLSASMTYAYLGNILPKAGGQYVFLREGYNSLVAFLYGWSFFAVIQTGTIAAVAVGFAKFLAFFFPFLGVDTILLPILHFKITAQDFTAIASILLLTYINNQGITSGKIVQSILTFIKIAAFALLILVGGWVIFSNTSLLFENFQQGFVFQKLSMTHGTLSRFPLNGHELMGALCVAMVGSLFSSIAWDNVTFVSDEMVNPEKNIGKSLLIGTFLVTFLYILMNMVYVGILPIDEIAFAKDDRVGVVVAQKIFGVMGTNLVAGLIVISTFGCNNGLILSGAHVYSTMAKDGLFFKSMAYKNKNDVPGNALWLQGIWASVLCLSGSYGKLLDYVMIIMVIFYLLTVLSVFRLKKKYGHTTPMKVPVFPFLQLFYFLGSGFFIVSLLVYKSEFTVPAVIILLLGFPIYYAFKKYNK